MNHKHLKDDESRLKIVGTEILDKNIFLSAGAGSGKTSSLINRVMALICSGVPISSIVAITFTREAAKMFYGRMTKELELMIAGALDTTEKERYQRAFEEIDDAFFGTIDSFCRKLLLEHPAEARISSQLKPLEKASDKRAIVDQALKLLLDSKEPSSAYNQYQELWKWDFKGDDFTQLLLYVLEEDIFDIDLGEKPEELKGPDLAVYLEEVMGIGLALKREYEERIIFGNSFLQSSELATKSSVYSYEKAIQFLTKNHPVNSLFFLENMVEAFSYRQDKAKTKAEKPELFMERSVGLMDNPYFEAIKREYQELRYYKALVWANEMRKLLLEIGEEKGLISYNRSLRRLVDMLQGDKDNSGELLSYLRKKYRYYLIDELQDTNQLQSQLFDLLADGYPGALFIVGDEKQAIYRFRGGDVDNFRRLEEDMMVNEEDAVLQLTCNFRSSQPLKEWFNLKFGEELFFGNRFPIIEQAEKQKQYELVKDKVMDGVYTFPVIQEKRKSSKGPRIPTDEHMQVVNIIEKIIGKPVSCFDHKSKNMGIHHLNYEDIIVLTYNKEKLNEYMTIFKQEDIPYSVVGSSNLKSSKSLAMMERVLDYLVDSENSYKEGRCLLQEPFSISEKELYQYKQGKTQALVQEVKNFIQALALEVEDKTPSAIYSHIMDRMKLIYMTSVYDIEDASDTLYYGLELVRQGEEGGLIKNLEDLGDFIRNDLLIGGYEYELSMSGKVKGVRLMNLHKSKGLEGKVVILADSVASSKAIKPGKQYDYENHTIKIFKIGKKGYQGVPNGDLIITDKFSEEMEIEKEKLEEEAMRLKYVAATRAENILLIPTLYKNEGDNSEIDPKPTAGQIVEGRWHSLLSEGLKNLLELNLDYLTQPGQSESLNSLISLEVLKDLDIKFQPPSFTRMETYETLNPSKVKLRESVKVEAKEPSEGLALGPVLGKITTLKEEYGNLYLEDDSYEEVEWQKSLVKWQRDGSVVGTLVHVLMEAMVGRLPELLREEECQVVISNLIVLYEIPKDDIDFFTEILWDVYKTMIGVGYPQEWVGEEKRPPQNLLEELNKADEIYTELPFSIYVEKDDSLMKELIDVLYIQENKAGYLNGIMDLVYKKNGEYYILDYKTNFSSQDIWDHYQAQIFLYKKVLKESFALEEEPKAYLYHIPARDESSLPKRKNEGEDD